MPPHTPSPHRFLAPAPAQNASQSEKQKPRSSLRQVATAQAPRATGIHPRGTHDDAETPKRVTPAKRFVVPPLSSRKPPSTGERGRRAEDENVLVNAQATPRPRPSFRKVESIDTTSPSSSANTEAHHALDVLPSIEQSLQLPQAEGHENETDQDEILFASEEPNKRQRMSPQSPSSPIPTFAGPSTPHMGSSPQMPSPVSHRFKMPSSRPAASNKVSTPALERQPNTRPHFILPNVPPSPTKIAVPLPETFSPSRKGGKYIQNGMASTLQSWIHETASTGYTANTHSAVVWGKDKEDGVKMKVEVLSVGGSRGVSEMEGEVECWPGGLVFVRGVTDAGLYNASRAVSLTQPVGNYDGYAEIKMMLAGQGGARGKGAVKIRVGDIVGIRAPIWEVPLGLEDQAENWLVGVEWVVL